MIVIIVVLDSIPIQKKDIFRFSALVDNSHTHYATSRIMTENGKKCVFTKILYLLILIFFQLHGVSHTKQDRQRDPGNSVKTPRSH